MVTATYVTSIELSRFLGIEKSIPDKSATGDRVAETLRDGKTDNRTAFFLSSGYVVGSPVISFGATALSTSPLTINTHYTLTKDIGKVVINSAASALIASNSIYAEYSHSNQLLTDTELQNAVNRAQAEVDSTTNSHFAISTDTTPDWNSVTEEKQSGKGRHLRDYFTDNRPVPNINASLTQTAALTANVLNVTSTNGFLSSGILSVGTNKVIYTGKNDTQFTGVTGIDTQVAGGVGGSAIVYPFAIEQSLDQPGDTPTWEVLEINKDYDFELETGKIHIFKDELSTDSSRVFYDSAPGRNIANRFRVSYIWGNPTIPDDLKKLTLMIAAKDVMHKAVRASHTTGRNDFNPDTINVDDDIIDKLMERFRKSKISTL